jgi:hypothetical protein
MLNKNKNNLQRYKKETNQVKEIKPSKTIKIQKNELFYNNLENMIDKKNISTEKIFKQHIVIKQLITNTANYEYKNNILYKKHTIVHNSYTLEDFIYNKNTAYVNNVTEIYKEDTYIPSEHIFILCQRTIYKLTQSSKVELVHDIINNVSKWYFVIYNEEPENIMIQEDIQNILSILS